MIIGDAWPLFYLLFLFSVVVVAVALFLLQQCGCCPRCRGGWCVLSWHFVLLLRCWFCCCGMAEVGFGGCVALAWPILVGFGGHGFVCCWVVVASPKVKILFVTASPRLAMGLRHCRFWWSRCCQGWLWPRFSMVNFLWLWHCRVLVTTSPRLILVAVALPRLMLLLQQCTAIFYFYYFPMSSLHFYNVDKFFRCIDALPWFDVL